jgi:single-strand DNA-binding protein
MARFSLACTEVFKKDDQWEEKTEWINCIAWGYTAKKCEKIVKGSLVNVTGKMQTRKWEKDGITHYKTEVVADTVTLLDPKKAAAATAGSADDIGDPEIDGGAFNEDDPF